MTEKLMKLSETWLLLESDDKRGLISLSHIDAIWANTKNEYATDLFLTGEQRPIQIDVPLDDVLTIVTGPPESIDKPGD